VLYKDIRNGYIVIDTKVIKVILYSYLILKKMNERITDSKYINKYT